MMQTPWGWADHVREITSGIIEVGTSSHGGIRLSPERIALIPKDWLRCVDLREGCWLEEDQDWCIAAMAFPEAFGERTVGYAKITFDAVVGSRLKAVEITINGQPSPCSRLIDLFESKDGEMIHFLQRLDLMHAAKIGSAATVERSDGAQISVRPLQNEEAAP